MNMNEQMEEMSKDPILIKEDVFRMIEHWSITFGLPVQKEFKMPPARRGILAFELIDEELKEFGQAQMDDDLRAIQDSLGDLLWVVVRAMMEYGIRPLECIQAIYDSNMSKLDYTLYDANKTAEQYIDKGVEVYITQHDKSTFTVHRKLDDKVLKSHKFVEPKFEQ